MTLTQAAIITRRGVLVISVTILILVSSKVGLDLYERYRLSQLPPPEEKAESKFGVLPDLNLPPTLVSSSNFAYSLDTPTGELPSLPKLIKVYFIPKTGITLLAPDRARALATKFQMENGPQTTTNNQYLFTDNQQGRLLIDIESGNFHLQTVASPSGELSTLTLPTEEQLLETFKRYLSTKIDLPKELHNGAGRAAVTPATPEQPPLANLSLWAEAIDQIPVVTAKYTQGLVSSTIIPDQDGILLYPNIDFIYWSVDLTTYSTYQLKTAVQAFDDLKAGRGFISIQPPTAQVSITSISLAYYQSESYSPYLQPVFVFEGPSFVALVPAIAQ